MATKSINSVVDAEAIIYANDVYSNFDDPSPINVAVTLEDFTAGYLICARRAEEGLLALEREVAYLAAVSSERGEKASFEVAERLEKMLTYLKKRIILDVVK